MSRTFFAGKTGQRPAHNTHLDKFAGSQGSRIAPPAYGIDLVDRQRNQTGLPDNLKAGVERLSGFSMDDVQVHYHSAAPAPLQALAYTRGTEIHVASGQERHLPHEAWHVVQQKQGRVMPTLHENGVPINDEAALEREADHMGRRAASYSLPIQTKAMPVDVSAPRPAGQGSYQIVAGTGQRAVGSVMVHDRDKRSIEVSDLGIDPSHRKQGLGSALIASALQTGKQMGKSNVLLASQDNGSGRLTGWYRRMGFAEVGVNQEGYTQLEAPINRLRPQVAQRAEKKKVKEPHKTKKGTVKASTLKFLADPPKGTTVKDISVLWESIKNLFDSFAVADSDPLPANTAAPTHAHGRPMMLDLQQLLAKNYALGKPLVDALQPHMIGDRGAHGNGEGKLPIYVGASPYQEFSYFKGGGRLVVDTTSGRRYISLHYSKFYRID